MGWSVGPDWRRIVASRPAAPLTAVFFFFKGLHEEVDYSEKLKFSDDEEEHAEKSKMW